MFCRRCDSQQDAEVLNACPRCGHALGCVADSPRRRAAARGVKCLLSGMALVIIGYLFATAKLILDGRIPAHDSATRELLLPLGYSGVALLLFVGPGLVLYGFVRLLYSFLEKGRSPQKTGGAPA